MMPALTTTETAALTAPTLIANLLQNGMIYDNGSQQSLGGGSIVVHK